jgi:pyridinium-3,5-biscarboxylic acid mononucleotide sulfurtransferase
MERYYNMVKDLRKYKKMAVAFSGGADSTLVLKAAIDAVGAACVFAYTVRSELSGKKESAAAKAIANELGVHFAILDLQVLSVDAVRNNRRDRCYHCKKAVFDTIMKKAKLEGCAVILEGTNADDTGVYRPGVRAIEENPMVISPLKEAGLTKESVRLILKNLGFKQSEKPSSPCFATRIPYGCEVTEKIIDRIEQGEDALKKALGISVIRLRHHGDIARLEVQRDDLDKVLKKREQVLALLKGLQYTFVTLDLEGYRSGCYDNGLGE